LLATSGNEFKSEQTHLYMIEAPRMLGREEWQEKYGPQIKDQTEVGLI
jgi:hypothetical protein